jgi:hypothetical protein
MRTAGGLYEDGECAGPFVHPIHGNATEERGLRAQIKFGGARVVGDEALFFPLVERVKFGAIDDGHELDSRISRLAATPV